MSVGHHSHTTSGASDTFVCMLESRTWKQNASEYAMLSVQGKDFRLALLAACSCNVAAVLNANKTSVKEFALAARTTPERVLRHLKAWEDMSKKSLVPPFTNLTPSHSVNFVGSERALEEFEKLYDATKSGGRPRSSISEIATRASSDKLYLVNLLNSLTPTARVTALNNLAMDVDAQQIIDRLRPQKAPVTHQRPAEPDEEPANGEYVFPVLAWLNEALGLTQAVRDIAKRPDGLKGVHISKAAEVAMEIVATASECAAALEDADLTQTG
jgi:hypothetical protein